MKRKVGSTVSLTNREVQPISLGNRPPVVDSCAAKGVHTHAEFSAANGVHVDHACEISNVSIEVVVPVGRGGAKSSFEGNPLHALEGGFEKIVCFLFNPFRDDALRRSAAWRVVLEATVMGRIVRRSNDNTVSESSLAPAVVK